MSWAFGTRIRRSDELYTATQVLLRVVKLAAHEKIHTGLGLESLFNYPTVPARLRGLAYHELPRFTGLQFLDIFRGLRLAQETITRRVSTTGPLQRIVQGREG